jgi:hypothetical protein
MAGPGKTGAAGPSNATTARLEREEGDLAAGKDGSSSRRMGQ